MRLSLNNAGRICYNSMKKGKKGKFAARIRRRADALKNWGIYMWNGVWNDHRQTFRVRFIKTVNLSVRTMMDPNLQTRSYALTFNTLLSIVPAFALMLAICKGFGLQSLLQDEIIRIFPSQRRMAETLMQLVNSYLDETSHGIFVGIGIIFLLYTVVTLMSEIENNFNWIWGADDDRTLYQKLVDYVAICLLIPVMLICSIGINIFMTDSVREYFHVPLLSPVIGVVLDLAPFFLVCIAFTFSFYWIPHTKVKLVYAAVSGVLCGIAFQILQLVFLNGQIMVSRYNAIYGSFAFLPLFLMWLMISWLIVLSGCVLTYSAQYVFCFPFTKSGDEISMKYYTKVLTVVSAVIAARYLRNQTPLSIGGISVKYIIPVRLVQRAVRHLKKAGLIYYVQVPGNLQYDYGIVPAVDLTGFTVADLLRRLDEYGVKNFIPTFDRRFRGIVECVDAIKDTEYSFADKTLLRDVALTIDNDLAIGKKSPKEDSKSVSRS